MLAKQVVVRAIVTTPAKPQGRGLIYADSPVTVYAKSHGLSPILTPQNLKEPSFIDQLKQYPSDLFVVIAYRVLPPEVFMLPRIGTINVHASLLPRFRGPAPIHRAIEAGEQTTGVTVFKIDTGVDTGNVILQKSLAIAPQETTPHLYERLSALGAQALAEACDQLMESAVRYIHQDHTVATRAPKLDKKEAFLDWKLPAGVLFNRIRAFKPFPGTCTMLGKKLLKIEWAEPVSIESGAPCGQVVAVTQEWFDVQCGEGLLRVLEVKPEGKKQMKVTDFLRGNLIEKGIQLG